MNADNIAQFAYLALMGAAITGWFIVQNRHQLGKTLQYGAIWGFIFIGVIAGIGLWSDIQSTIAPRQSYVDGKGIVEIPRAGDGHYYITLMIDTTPVKFVIDTGASDVVLTKADAARIGIDINSLFFNGIANTANGEVRTARITLHNVRLGEIYDKKIRASVNDGEMDGSLLGMTYLQRFSKIEIGGGKLILRR